MALFRNAVGDVEKPFFVEVVQRGSFTGSSGDTIPSLNVYHFHRLSNSPPFDPTNVIAVVQTALEAKILACLNVRYNLEQWECRSLDDPAAATAVIPVSEPGLLGDGESAYDALSAVYYLLRTGYRGRSFFGSKHFGPIDEDDVDGDALNDDALTGHWNALTTAFMNMRSGLVDADVNTWFPFVLSRTLSSLGPTDIPALVTGADWSDIKLNRTIGSMRRRKDRTVR